MRSLILTGGSGTRLWPLSRQNYPKQFLKIGQAQDSLLQATFKRLLKVSKAEDIFFLTGTAYRGLIEEQMQDVPGVGGSNFIEEPQARNTMPAITLAVKYLMDVLRVDADEPVIVSPADHYIADCGSFAEYVGQAAEIASQGHIVTFGVLPDRAETGYGYIRGDSSAPVGSGYRVAEFTEKPSREKAEQYVASGRYFWNSGMFIFTCGTFMREMREHAADFYALYENVPYGDMLQNFASLPAISVDYALMEKSRSVSVIPMDIAWSDIGSYDQIYEGSDKDGRENVLWGDVCEFGSCGNFIAGGKRLIAAVGIEDLIVVDTDDALLLVKRGSSQDIKHIVENLKAQGRDELRDFVDITFEKGQGL